MRSLIALALALSLTTAAFPQETVDCEKDLKKAAQLVNRYWSFMLFKPGAFDLEQAYALLAVEAKTATSPDACADILQRFMAHLRDGHSALRYFPDMTVRTAPEIELRSFRERIVRSATERPRVRLFVVSRDTADSALVAVKPGSEVLEVDGVPVDSVYWWMHDRISGSTRQWRDHLADARVLYGPAETEVRLTLRDLDRNIYEVAVRRPPDPYGGDEKARREAAKLEYDTMTVAESKVLDGGWGYLKLNTFAWKSARETVQEFDDALAPILDRPGIILDLRDNGGGLLSVVTDIVGRFIHEKIVVTYYQARQPGARYVVEFWDPKRGGSTIPPIIAKPRTPIYEGPVLVLIDAGCFSACEIFAGGVQSVGRVTVVGTGPSGGGSGPVVASRLPSKAIISFSVAITWRPDGTQIEHNGVEPDVKVFERPTDWAEGRDAVLEKAIELLEAGRAPTLADMRIEES